MQPAVFILDITASPQVHLAPISRRSFALALKAAHDIRPRDFLSSEAKHSTAIALSQWIAIRNFSIVDTQPATTAALSAHIVDIYPVFFASREEVLLGYAVEDRSLMDDTAEILMP